MDICKLYHIFIILISVSLVTMGILTTFSDIMSNKHPKLKQPYVSLLDEEYRW